MVEQVAKNGRGSCSLVADKSEDLNSKVITSLMHAFEPSLQACKLTFAGEEISLGEVFRNQSITKCKIISRLEFESLKFSFTSELDPMTN
jgi:hypothetical protein